MIVEVVDVVGVRPGIWPDFDERKICPGQLVRGSRVEMSAWETTPARRIYEDASTGCSCDCFDDGFGRRCDGRAVLWSAADAVRAGTGLGPSAAGVSRGPGTRLS